jgi:hypothetical protein
MQAMSDNFLKKSNLRIKQLNCFIRAGVINLGEDRVPEIFLVYSLTY